MSGDVSTDQSWFDFFCSPSTISSDPKFCSLGVGFPLTLCSVLLVSDSTTPVPPLGITRLPTPPCYPPSMSTDSGVPTGLTFLRVTTPAMITTERGQTRSQIHDPSDPQPGYSSRGICWVVDQRSLLFSFCWPVHGITYEDTVTVKTKIKVGLQEPVHKSGVQTPKDIHRHWRTECSNETKRKPTHEENLFNGWKYNDIMMLLSMVNE